MSTTVCISGCTPGQLDTAQATRLLHSPHHRLSFASFDPRTAFPTSTIPDLQNLTIKEELYRPKRVVIETAPTGESSWRFVPNAKREEGVPDEGRWPRTIDICGQQITSSLEQWEIYKLDPLYQCLVRAPPALSEISRTGLREQPPKSATNSPARTSSTKPNSKRRLSSPPIIKGEEGVEPQRKYQKCNAQPNAEASSSKTTLESSDEEEDELDEETRVESMVVDGETPPHLRRAKSSGPARARKLKLEKDREERRGKHAKVAQKKEGLYANPNLFHFSPPKSRPDGLADTAPKRKVSSLFDSLRSRERDSPDGDELPSRSTATYTSATTSSYKRTRTVSPRTATREIESKRREREKQKAERQEQKLQERRLRQEKQFMEEVLAEVPAFTSTNGAGSSSNGTQQQQQQPNSPIFNVDIDEDENENENEITPEDREAEETARRLAIAESRRKLAQLEADKPLWESEAKKRQARERAAEEDARRFKLQEQARINARKAEAEQRARALQLEQEARDRRAREETRARMEREKRQRNQRYSMGPWTVQRALERYKTFSESFDNTKFGTDTPISFDTIPWPVLRSPVALSVEDIDWAAVEKFFDTVKPHMKTQDYKKFVIASHRRFHPDRWRSRGLLKSVEDEAERECLEIAANTVAQALTPVWRDLMGK